LLVATIGVVAFLEESLQSGGPADFQGMKDPQLLVRKVTSLIVAISEKPYGMNWKMTAKTILVQMHHKIQTFEHVHKKLVLVVQDRLLTYMNREFNFAHLKNPAVIGDSMHLHAYRMDKQPDNSFKLAMQSQLSTDVEGIATCLGLQAEARVELEQIVQALQAKLSPSTLFVPA
jgi:hypothetical protein